MSGWRKEYEISEIQRDFEDYPCQKGNMTCEAFLDHLKSESKKCTFHRATLSYFESFLCKDEGEHLGLEVGHWSLYGKADERRTKSLRNEEEFIAFREIFVKEKKAERDAAIAKQSAITDANAVKENTLLDKGTATDDLDAEEELHDDTNKGSNTKRARNRRVRKARSRRRKAMQSDDSLSNRYYKVLVLGAQFENSFSKELAFRIEEESSETNYVVGKKAKPSKDVSDTIRGYHFRKKTTL